MKQQLNYCDIDYFMKHKCNGCKRGRKCEEWNKEQEKKLVKTKEQKKKN